MLWTSDHRLFGPIKIFRGCSLTTLASDKLLTFNYEKCGTGDHALGNNRVFVSPATISITLPQRHIQLMSGSHYHHQHFVNLQVSVRKTWFLVLFVTVYCLACGFYMVFLFQVFNFFLPTISTVLFYFIVLHCVTVMAVLVTNLVLLLLINLIWFDLIKYRAKLCSLSVDVVCNCKFGTHIYVRNEYGNVLHRRLHWQKSQKKVCQHQWYILLWPEETRWGRTVRHCATRLRQTTRTSSSSSEQDAAKPREWIHAIIVMNSPGVSFPNISIVSLFYFKVLHKYFIFKDSLHDFFSFSKVFPVFFTKKLSQLRRPRQPRPSLTNVHLNYFNRSSAFIYSAISI